ncbi:MAG: pyrroline-5-carboxylate reductase [bacterium]
MNYPTIGFIGGGNMATSIIGGLLANGCPASQILVSDPLAENRERLATTGVNTFADNSAVADGAELIVVAVKPQIMSDVARGLAEHLNQDAVVISIAAGITVQALKDWLGNSVPVIRCMPNTPALLKQGASGLYASPDCSAQQRQQAEAVLSAVGLVEWVEDETLIDVITAVSGSGPAYFFLVMEMIEKVGSEMGLAPETARKLTIQTALGAAQMAASDDIKLSELRRRVTSPGGTTEQAILAFDEGGIENLFRNAMQRCLDRAETMASEFHRDSTK